MNPASAGATDVRSSDVANPADYALSEEPLSEEPLSEERLSEETLSDDALAAGTLAGRQSCFHELMCRYQVRLIRYFRQISGKNEQEVEDLVQDTFLRVYCQLDKYDSEKSQSVSAFQTWLFVVARRVFLNSIRKKQLPIRQLDDTADGCDEDLQTCLLAELSDGSPSASAMVQQKEQKELLWSMARRCLSEPQWSALWLRYAENMSLNQIAQTMGKKTERIKGMLYHAKKRLAQYQQWFEDHF